MTLKVQKIHQDDWRRFKSIRLASLQDSPDAFGSILADAHQLSDTAWMTQVHELPTYIGMVNEKDAGVVRAAIDKDDDQSCWLLSMWVSPRARGQGLGDLLIQAIVSWAKKQNITRVLLDVGQQNTKAQQLYERNGFKPNGVVGSLPAPRDHIKEYQMELLL